ncbi:hypothetical protein GGS23DRAFT_558070 [Durotheca rogersii]|uniref:uncharacterized protein n=1 Tax=Durotheca rogersii TaxID=419775 RepID=UPI00221F7671|nr:uncharacterized protein GGS23DRAFT_558070 [Durotheca rogersii]KAI5865179.1 hypothetical protein GGS23DRAFT_558070 [Durotheca rogersii]
MSAPHSLPSQISPPAHPHQDSFGANSETTRASSELELTFLNQPSPSLPDEDQSLPFHSPTAVPASRNPKNLVIDSAAVQPPARSIRRKPLSSTASSIAARYSSGEYLALAKGLASPEQRFSRSFSLDSPTLYEFPRPPPAYTVRSGLESPNDIILIQGNTDKSPSIRPLPHPLSRVDSSPAVVPGEVERSASWDRIPVGLQTDHHSESLQHHHGPSLYDDLFSDEEDERDGDGGPLNDNIFDEYNSDPSDTSDSPNSPKTMSLHITRKNTPPQLSLRPVDLTVTPTADKHDIKTPNTDKPLPKSPGSSKLGSFFGWAASPSAADTSDKGFSPLPSPFNFSKAASATDVSPSTTIGPHSLFDPPKILYGAPNSRDYRESYLATPPTAPLSPAHLIEDMEDELRAIAAELASSIRREIDLEDLVDRLQAEKDNPTSSANKRTSDYFSDSGNSTTKLSDYDQSREEIERIQRRSEQEKAQIRLELTSKLQDERTRRQQLDEQIRELSERASQIDLAKANNTDTSGRVKELETTCDTLRRKLTEERQVKDNFEDLLTALKGELEDASNERDNLRDEVVPQLRARVEGLEAQAVELEKMGYESTKMQQELQTLKMENTSLKQLQVTSMDTISEEGGNAGFRLSRSNSLTGPPSSLRPQRPPSLSRSMSVKTSESRDQIAERLKDVEEQRDALHRALKSLLERQEHQNKENDKKIRILEMERDRLLTESPQKAGFKKEISNLRAEINVLRRRAEEALEQKWQVEKGLGGLKMDLDRAEQEIASLRSLLDEKDILIPPSLARQSTASEKFAAPVSSDSLTAAYQSLQKAYAESLERIRKLEAGSSPDEMTRLAMERLERTLTMTISERDLARQEATSYKEQLDALKAGERVYLESEKALADELNESARRVEELAAQVRHQLSISQTLRQRISDTVARGDVEQKANKDRITALQEHLRTLEERLEAAQQASEERVARHEEEMAAVKMSHNDQLKRMRDGLRSPRMFPPKSPMSPLFATQGSRSPRLSVTRSGPAMKASEEAQVDNLRARVAELENALADADSSMQQVVGRMNAAQIEVLQLQEEREAAVNRARKLERELEAEMVKAFNGRFKSLQS